MRQNYEDEQHLEKGHWGDEKVRRDTILHMVLKESVPRLRGRLSVTHEVFGNSGL